MPRYDFTCEDCKNTFDEIIPMKELDDRKPLICPNCSSKNTLQLIGKGLNKTGPLILTPDTFKLTGRRKTGLETRPGYKKFY